MKAVEKEKPPVFPFSALVGQELMKTALILNAVDPGIGGVLIRGQKGTGKTTAVRSLQAVLPPLTEVTGCPYHCSPQDPAQMHRECRERFEAGESLPVESIPTPLVNLPLNATEDRIVGTLQLEEALSRGVRKFDPGLLASAHRGVLYIDAVNLLDDHLVDLLLDAAATGINTVEREGVSYSHPSRFMLIGTMNPEDGELRPQFLDRFGLCVHVATLPSREERREIVKRRIQFEEDPRGFIDQWKEQEELLSRCISEARERIASYKAGEEILDAIVRIAEEAGAVGHRAEIILLKAARALAAFTAALIRWEHFQE
jgi:Mg-chelatase subunit ChlI